MMPDRDDRDDLHPPSGRVGPTGKSGPEGRDPEPTTEAEEDESWPIGFMLILTLVVLYLGWRLIQGIGWVIDHL